MTGISQDAAIALGSVGITGGVVGGLVAAGVVGAVQGLAWGVRVLVERRRAVSA